MCCIDNASLLLVNNITFVQKNELMKDTTPFRISVLFNDKEVVFNLANAKQDPRRAPRVKSIEFKFHRLRSII